MASTDMGWQEVTSQKAELTHDLVGVVTQFDIVMATVMPVARLSASG